MKALPAAVFDAALGMALMFSPRWAWAPSVFALVAITRILRSGMPLPLKVVSSWLTAVAALAATLELLPVTPGYLPDHLD